MLSFLQIFGLEPSFLESFEIVNPYGLFAVMTTSRTELSHRRFQRQRPLATLLISLQAGRLRSVACPSWRPISPDSTGKCGLPPSARPKVTPGPKPWFTGFLMGQPTVLALLRTRPFCQTAALDPYSSLHLHLRRLRKNAACDGAVWQRKLAGNLVWSCIDRSSTRTEVSL